MSPAAVVPLIAWWAVSAGADYVRGMALAKAGHWDAARAAFETGARKAPRDKRFPLELAGVAYRQRERGRARAHLRNALALDPADAYANEFLGTLYLLEDNVEAALKYWNRIGKPRVDDVQFDPEPRLDPVLADRALAFSPASVLAREDYRASRKRLEFLGVFTDARIALESREGDGFDAVVRARERRRGWLSLVRGLPFETVYAELPNLRGSGASISSLVRWDRDKRRLAAEFTTPVARDPGWRIRTGFDLRDENWIDSKLKKAEVGLTLARLTTSGMEWSAGASASTRTREGGLMKARGSLKRDMLSVPERRFRVTGTAAGEVGRWLKGGRVAKIETGAEARWRELGARFRTGAVGGKAPFDEMFLLGVERDSDLWLRGHPATRDGKKGSGPLGRSFALANIDWRRPVWRPGFVTLEAGPFVDAGRAAGSGWLVDPGVQGVASLQGGPGVAVSWSRRTVYVSVSPVNW